MKNAIVIMAWLACAAGAQPPGKSSSGAHEAAEDRARAVRGGASLGVKACHEDIERFCKSVQPGQGRLGKCLKAHAQKLSKPCRRWLAHGGEAHVDRAFQEIDESTRPAKAPAGHKERAAKP